MENGVAMGFGTDGASSGNTLDLFIQMRMFAGAQKTKYHDRSLFPAKEIVRIATIEGCLLYTSIVRLYLKRRYQVYMHIIYFQPYW